MYFTNAIVLSGVVFVGIGLLLFAVQLLARTVDMRAAIGAALKTAVATGLVMVLLGVGVGFTHQKGHADCQTLKSTADAPAGDLEKCQYFFDAYGE